MKLLDWFLWGWSEYTLLLCMTTTVAMREISEIVLVKIENQCNVNLPFFFLGGIM